MAISHKFRVGERLRFNPPGLMVSQRGIYEVLSLLPRERGDSYQYRLKSTVDSHQRVALEDQLSR